MFCRWCTCTLLIACLTLAVNAEKQTDATVHIEAGDRQCFYEQVKQGQIIDVEYQVIDGGHGDFDINFELAGPNGYYLARDYKKSDNIHRVTASEEGDHEFCFDNSFSTFSRKTVFFEIIIETEGEATDEWSKEVSDNLSRDEILEGQVNDDDSAQRERERNTIIYSFVSFHCFSSKICRTVCTNCMAI